MGTPLTLSSVPNLLPYIQYVAGSGQTVFPYPFPITQDSDLVVIANGVTLATDAGYTLSGQGNPTGGNLTFTVGRTNGDIITLYRNVAIQRITQISQNSGFDSTAFNAEFNNIYLILQQLQESLAFALQVPNTNSPAPTVILTPASYAGKYLSFDSNGNPTPAQLTNSGSLTGAIIAGLLNTTTATAPTADLVRTAAEITNGVTPVNYSLPPGNVLRYAANTTPGTTDMATAINNAALCNSVVYLPAGLYRVASTVSIPAGVLLQGAGVISPASADTAYGSAIVGDLAVTPVVTLGANTLHGAAAKGFSIFRAAGSVGGSTIGLEVKGGQGPIVEDVYSFGHGTPVYLLGQSSGTAGAIASMFARVFTGGAVTQHVAVDTWPEARFSECRFGTNGSGDVNCTAYVTITGGLSGAGAAGPNTIVFDNCQFNQGANNPTYWLNFVTLASPGLPTLDARTFLFTNCHIEAVSGALINADSSWASLDRLGLVNNSFNTPATPFFNLIRASMILNGWRVANNYIACSTFAPGVDNINSLSVTGNVFDNCTVTYAAGSVGSWTLASVGNSYENGATCTLTGSVWNSGVFMDTFRPSSTFTNSATPNKAITALVPGQSLVSWTPTITFGGAASGVTYGANTAGTMQVSGNAVTLQWRIVLTSKGVSTGSAVVLGAPIAFNAGAFQTGAGGVAFGNSNMSGLGGAILAQGPIGSPRQIQLLAQGASGTTPLADTNFTNTSDIAGHVTYFF